MYYPRMLSLLAGSVVALTAVAASAQEVELPCNTAKLIVPWNPGGDTDIIFRAAVDAANKAGIDPQLQVVNVAGQGGTQGAREAMGAAPDGCTLLAIHESVITSFLTGVVDFTWDDFEPIALLSYSPSIIGAAKDVPFENMDDLVAAAKQAPETITTGATLGSTSHFVFVIIEDRTGIKLKYVPYDGTRDRLTAMLAGNIQLGEMNVITAKQYISEGSLKALGIASNERDPALPDLPTLKEQGIDVTYGTSRGIVAPKGAKPEVIAYWEGVLEAVAQDPDFVKALESQGTAVSFEDAETYTDTLGASFDSHKQAAINLGLYTE